MNTEILGSRSFYSRLIKLALPMMIQNGITNFVNMLDNIMIGAVGTAPMTGVAIANQLFFVFNLCIFGAVAGAGIFGAQFFGSGDREGVGCCFRFKLLFCGSLTALGLVLFGFWGEELLNLYMQGDAGVTDPTATIAAAKSYLHIMLIGVVPFTIVQCYSSTLREGSRPGLPMAAGIAAVLVNLSLNYVLIFGKLGAPALGVAGAAIATVVSRFTELAVVLLGTHLSPRRYEFMQGIYRSLRIPRKLMGELFMKSLPLLVNEFFWASGMAFISQCYSLRGLDSVAAFNISQTFWNVFSIAYMAMGMADGIIMGQILGSGRLKEAKESGYRMIIFSFLIAVFFGALYYICAGFIPMAYNVEPEIRLLATRIMRISAIVMPLEAICHASYFILRSGGRMMVTFLFDSVYMWCINVALAFVLSRFTPMSFVSIFALVQISSALKSGIGIALVKSGFWVRNIVSDKQH